MMIKYLIQKEFKQLFRNPVIPKIVVVLPLMAMLVFPWAANQEITNIDVVVVDRDHSSCSQRLTRKVAASDYFNLVAVSPSNEAALAKVEEGKADLILEIQPDFEKRLMTEGTASTMISANAVNIMKGGLSSNYMGNIIRDFANELRSENLPVAGKISLPVIQITAQNRFNPFMDYKIFMAPAIIVMLLTIICGFLPALNIVSEKETGTIEQINVTPVRKFPFILAKLIPYWTIGVVVITLCMALAAVTYKLIPAGNLLTIYCFALIYILVVSGFGLLISNHSTTMQQAMFSMFFFLIIMILLSGLFTPIASMPQWAQTVTRFNPLRYFIEVMRMVYLKGSNIWQLGNQFVALSLFAVVLNGWAILSYRKNK
jgi:ABC-2 type transport system permease protein